MNEQDWKCRTELLITPEGVDKLKKTHVLIAGLGGVGGAAAEQLCRAGVGHITLIDNDIVQPSNINRQIIALQSTIGRHKTEICAKRLKNINPEVKLTTHKTFIEGNKVNSFINNELDYVVDAIDTLTPKVELLEACIKNHVPVVSSMGSGGRLNPSLIKIDDIKNTNHCKFAYLVRKYLHKRGIRDGINAVFSTEQVPKHAMIETDGSNYKRTIVGTISYMPVIFGCFCASWVINKILTTNSSK
jgi:tRNA A37 threonylcarbamoyladenosine dehydratase